MKGRSSTGCITSIGGGGWLSSRVAMCKSWNVLVENLDVLCTLILVANLTNSGMTIMSSRIAIKGQLRLSD